MFTPSAMIALTSPMLKIVSAVFHDCTKPVPMKRQATSANSSSGAHIRGLGAVAVDAGTEASALISPCLS
jgi:hypothetical protein